MTRMLAAVCAVMLVLSIASAQNRGLPPPMPFGGGGSHLPFEVVEHEGATGWKVIGRGSLPVEDLVGGLSSALNKRIAFTSAALASSRKAVPYVAPESGVIIPANELLDFANEILAAGELAIVGMSGQRGTLATFREAAAYAPLLTTGELESLPSGEWATVTVSTTYAGHDIITQAIRPTVAEGVVSVGMRGSQVVLSGPVAQVGKLVRVIESLDNQGAGHEGETVKSYALPEGMQAAQAVSVLRELFAAGTTTVTDFEGKLRVTDNQRRQINVVPLSGNRVLVRATPPNQALAGAAIEAMR